MTSRARTVWASIAGESHRLLQRVLAPGADRRLDARLREWLGRTDPPSSWLLDVGAGSRSRFTGSGRRIVAVDVSMTRVRSAALHGARGVVASADALPFRDHCFNRTAAVGLLHHLPDERASAAVGELVRVTARGGHSLVLDAVLPASPGRRPIPWMLRRLDRGRWMREQGALEVLLTALSPSRVERFSYSWLGLEALLAARERW